MKVGALESHDVLRADAAQDLDLLRAAHDVDQGDAVLEADPVEHLAEVGGGGGVHERGVALAAHRLDHAERGQRVDEAGRAVGRRGALRQRQAVATFTQRYCAYIAPPTMATVLPSSACAAADDPA